MAFFSLNVDNADKPIDRANAVLSLAQGWQPSK